METKVVTYPHSAFAPEYKDYSVKVNGQQQFVYPARVSQSPYSQMWRGEQRSCEVTEQVGFVVFEADGAVTLDVDCFAEYSKAVIRPDRAGVKVSHDLNHLTFVLPEPGSYILELNGSHKALHIFFHPIETEAEKPDPNDPNVIYFEPGLYHAGVIEPKSGQTLYLAGGALVYGSIRAEKQENIKICGHGILDSSNFSRDSRRGCLNLTECKNVSVKGIVLRDSPAWTFHIRACRDIEVDRVQILGAWRYNSDGIDIVHSERVTVRNCFVRAFDDCIVFKAFSETCPLKDILVENCVLWNDWGRAVELGAETIAPAMENIRVRNCDIVHFMSIAVDIQGCGSGPIHDIVFEELYVGDPLDLQLEPRLLEIFLRKECWVTVETLSCVYDVYFRNIHYTGSAILPCRFIGAPEGGDMRGVHLDNITLNGHRLTNAGHILSPILYNEYAHEVFVDGMPIDKDKCIYESEEDTCTNFQIANGAFLLRSYAEKQIVVRTQAVGELRAEDAKNGSVGYDLGD